MTTQQQRAAICPKGGKHYWIVEPYPVQVHTCRECKEVRVYAREITSDFTEANVPQKTEQTLRPKSKVLREMLIALKVGQSARADHTHLVCKLGVAGGVTKCGLQNNIKALQRRMVDAYRDRKWTYTHSKPGIATVTRVR